MKEITINGREAELYQQWKDELQKKEVSRKPKDGDKYFWICDNGDVIDTIWRNSIVDLNRLKHGGVFLSEEAAEMETLRRKARANTWLADEGEKYCWFNFCSSRVDTTTCFNNTSDRMFFNNGNMFPNTPEGKVQCKEWGEKYSKAFELPNK